VRRESDGRARPIERDENLLGHGLQRSAGYVPAPGTIARVIDSPPR
jgi:hypothetical protein